jgi:CubicO group peptidase (beta-lactamase class C family)
LRLAGSFRYTKTFGTRTLKDGSSSAPMDVDTVFWMGSCTKLLTSIAALQCVGKGLFTLDEDVTRLVPELKDIEVKVPPADGEGEPTMHKAKNKITLR